MGTEVGGGLEGNFHEQVTPFAAFEVREAYPGRG